MSPKLQQIAKKSRTAIIAYRIYDNWSSKQRLKSGNTESFLGSTHEGRGLSESLGYIQTQFEDYKTCMSSDSWSIEGKRVLEVGFGDNIGVALKFIAGGASHVCCLDKFYANRDSQQEREIYVALRDTLDSTSKANFDTAINLEDGVTSNPDKIRCIYGVDIENSKELADGELFDLVISRAALQEIYDPDPTFAAMDKLLAPGGYMMHKIDLGDQGMFHDYGMNPLTFLTIPESIYRLMARDSRRPNRKLIDYYRRTMTKLGYESASLITDVIGRKGKGDLKPHRETLDVSADYFATATALVKEIRPKLTPHFKRLSDDELMISGIFLVAKKPA